ncbi:hypothetical protein LuPra_02888 [Luteitalea pratensis]|uniref:Uncharacterized protein n=2 Tax=Luteitalea pratensis TaxID=1855912 RepID=A0A143PML0_LUTPR|nr:hypothetical protein LuPra_02888 [Luteitalea pratensis]
MCFTRHRFVSIAVLLLMLCASRRPVSASVVVPLSLAQLTEAADLVADVTVIDIRTMPGPDGVERVVQLQVMSTWKGGAERTVFVRLAGGRLGPTETRVAGVPVVHDGDRLVMFLVTHPRGGYSVLGLHQGALAAVTGADGTARVLAPARMQGARGDVTRAPRRIAELEGDVRSIAGTEGAR